MRKEGDLRSLFIAWSGPVVVGLLLVLVFALAWYHFLRHPASFNSDHLYCLHFCDDLLHHRDMQGWHLPAAPYLFPDMVLVSGLALLTSNIAVIFILYTAVHYLFTLAVLMTIFRLLGISWRQSFIAAGLGLMLLLAVCWHPDYIVRNLLLLHPGNHMSSQLVGLAAAALILHALQRGYRALTAVLFVAVCGLSGLSDQLLIVQYLAPIGGATLLLGMCRLVPARRAFFTMALLGIVALLAMTKQSLLTRLGIVPMNYRPSLRAPRLAALREFLSAFWTEFRTQPLMLVVLFLHLTGALTALVIWVRRSRQRTSVETSESTRLNGTAVLFLLLVLILAPLSNAGALIVTNMVNCSTLDRYLYTWLLLPFLFVALWPKLLPWRPVTRLIPVTISAVIALRILTFPDPLALDRICPRYPPLAQALDEMIREHGRLRGFADYWHAREMHYLTHEHVDVLPIVPWGLPWFHGFNPNAFLGEDRHDLSVPEYHFVILPTNGDIGPDAEHIRSRYGKPVEIILAENSEIWRYERLESRQLDLFLRAQLAQRLVEARAFRGPVEPSILSVPKRNLTPWDARGNVALRREQALTVRFDPPVTGCMINVAANYADEYLLRFLRGGKDLGKARVPPVEWNGAEDAYCRPGLQARLVEVPQACRSAGFDEVRLIPVGRSQQFALGHFLVFDEWLPYAPLHKRDDEKYRRFEGEALARLESSEVTTFADPSASAGQARQATATYQGFLAYGPYVPLQSGRYRVDFSLKIAANASRDTVVKLDSYAFAGQQCLQARSLRGVDFPATDQYRVFSLIIESEEELDLVEFRVQVCGKAQVTLDYVDVTCITAEKTQEPCEP